ncbi:hypothetical protein PILCRDRAFT_333940 [Piloderma croceum F 1598]|uniref:Uncharacterized protein n=1 Tax=Piloderma croceum (strain F 1598) TaxID=765440 RepID=A0A0C3G659_PILCF|nr:hypothetical protein PILCRDRAFT_333940 [Piloderma croceum F 1598]
MISKMDLDGMAKSFTIMLPIPARYSISELGSLSDGLNLPSEPAEFRNTFCRICSCVMGVVCERELLTCLELGCILLMPYERGSRRYTCKPKPSDLLLNYNYGAAVVKLWRPGT